MAMAMGNKEVLRAHKAHHLFGTTPNCQFLCDGEWHPGRDLVPMRAYAIPAYMACLQMSLDVLSD